MFTLLVVQPIFNLLVVIYALIPGHNFGLAIVLFTVLVRMAMWPLVKKQLHHAKAMRALQPAVKLIKQKAKGDRKKESRMVMELYKERQINPFSSIGILLVQLPILLGLYYGIKRIVDDPKNIIDFSYPWVANLDWMQTLAQNITQFDATLFGVIDLTRKAVDTTGIYWPAMILVIATAIAQYYQSKQLLPNDKDARSLRSIMRDAKVGKKADQQEVSAAVGKGTVYLIPIFIFVFSLGFAAALPLYWFVSALVALVQQTIILRDDTVELEALAQTKTEAKKDAPKKPSKTGTTVTYLSEADLEGETKENATEKPKPKKKSTQAKRKKRRR